MKKVINFLVQIFLSYALSYNRVQFVQAKEKEREINVTDEKVDPNATKYYEKRKIVKPSKKKNLETNKKSSIKKRMEDRKRIAAEEKQAWDEYEKLQEDKAWEWKKEQELKESSKAALPKLVEAPGVNDPVPKEIKAPTPFSPEVEKILEKDYEDRIKLRQEKQKLKQADIQSAFKENLKEKLKDPLKTPLKTPSPKKPKPFLKSPEIEEKLPELEDLSDFLNASNLKKPFFSEYELPITAALLLCGGLSMGNVTFSIVRHFIFKKGTAKEFVETVLQDPKFQFNLAIALIAPIALLSTSNLFHFIFLKRFNKTY